MGEYRVTNIVTRPVRFRPGQPQPQPPPPRSPAPPAAPAPAPAAHRPGPASLARHRWLAGWRGVAVVEAGADGGRQAPRLRRGHAARPGLRPAAGDAGRARPALAAWLPEVPAARGVLKKEPPHRPAVHKDGAGQYSLSADVEAFPPRAGL